MEKSKLSQIVISEAFETIKRENRKLQKENAELKKYSNLRQKDIEQFKHFGDLLRIGIFLITPDGLLIDCNAQFTEMLGQSEKDKILGINIFNNYFTGFSKVDFLNEIIVKKTVLELEVKLNSDAEPGKRFYLSAEGTIDSNGRIKQIIGTLRNISERMESAAADIQLFKDLTDNAKDGILIANDRAFFIYANKKAAELLGYSEEELLTFNYSNLVHPDELLKINDRYFGNFRGRKNPSHFETVVVRKDGSIMPVEVTSSVTVWLDKPAFLIVFSEMNYEKKQKDLLEKGRDNYHLLFYHMIDGAIYCRVDVNSAGKPEDIVILEANSAFLTANNVINEDIAGKSIKELDLSVKDDQFDWIKVLGNVPISGTPLILEQYFAATGRWYTISAYCPRKDYLVVIFKDITEKKSVMKNLIQTHGFYLKLLDDLPVIVWKCDSAGMCDFLNKKWREFTGRRIEQDLGEGWMDLIHPEDINDCARIFKESFPLKLPLEMEYRMLHKSGEYRWIIDIGKPYDDQEGNFCGYFGACFDITIYKKTEEAFKRYAEELQEMNSSKDKFFSIISHDLKSPFFGLRTVTETMISEIESLSKEEIVNFTREINNSLNYMYKLVENLIQWARLNSGLYKFNPSQVSLNKIANDVQNILLPNASVKNIVVENQIEDSIWAFADKDMLNSIIQNLLSNAIKFTRPGGKVSISAVQKEREVEVCINDTGIGIPESLKDQLFRIDKQKSTEGTIGERGTGFGLIICKEMVSAHGGTIRVESSSGKGTAVCFNLPGANSSDDSSI